MARPVAADAEATRARILASALALVAQRGIEGTSLRDVASAAHVSIATVLHYFGSKEGLYGACIDAMYDELEELRTALLAAVRPGVSLDQVIADAVRAAFGFVRAHLQVHRILLRTVVDDSGMRLERRHRTLVMFVEDIGGVLAPLLGVEPQRARLSAQSVVHLVVRYVLQTSEEVCLLTGKPAADEAWLDIENHVIDLARALLLARRPP